MLDSSAIATISLSEIASSVLSGKLYCLREEAMGAIRLLNLDLKNFRSRIDVHTSLVILNLPTWSSDHLRLMSEIRQQGHTGPVLALVKSVATWTEETKGKVLFRDVKFLEKPFADKELVGLVRRILSLQSVHSRVHPRYEIEKRAELVLSGDNDRREVLLMNVSRGGACLNVGLDSPVVAGRFVTLNVQLSEAEPPQSLRARVAWVQPARGMAGLEFLKAA